MCRWIERSYGCGHKGQIASYWCLTYRQKKKRCKPVVAHWEYRWDEKCTSCREQRSTAQHRAYLRQIYKDLKLRHPERNWDKIGRLANLPVVD